jgi:hypothetical protein
VDIAERLLQSPQLPAPFERRKDGSLEMSATIAERKAFLSKKKLTYSCRLRVDDAAQTVRFYEILVEKGSGMSSGPDDISPGFGFKKESYSVGGKAREGSIEEQSSLFGKDYSYDWDYATVRRVVEAAASEAGYRLEVVLLKKSV